MSRRRDTSTLDLFTDWTPPVVVERFEELSVRAVSWRVRVAKAVAAALESCETPRDEVATAMSEWLGDDETVTRGMLDNYASQAKNEHTISFIRMIALAVVTGDARLLQLAAEPLGHVVVEQRYLGAIREAMATERIERLEKERRDARRDWLKGRA
ncbi:hypothetical protein J2X65_002004 [Ancylobacter sp. 3268]|uniref:hypothetical protein n=1 Tax=Ancylobacter sp. 3268 TaxID=2817752 RepID=UPI002863F821|nr:hypothetical protein [Ancylobacter sp. 3268]MDR6952645.1 hypothetical protein [Ancylobacter sp. 3268]